MHSLLRTLSRVDKMVAKCEAGFLVLLLVAMTAVVLLQVIFRYFFAQPLSWTEELARYFFVWICLVGSALSVHKAGHFGMEAIYKLLPDNAKRVVRFVIYFLMGVIILVILVHGILLVEHTTDQRSPATGISMSWIYSCLPAGAALMAIHLLTLLLKDLLGRPETPRD
jgi:TRAP-type transport system small permease protein